MKQLDEWGNLVEVEAIIPWDEEEDDEADPWAELDDSPTILPIDEGGQDIEEAYRARWEACDHAWEPTVLIYTTVYDCTKCGAKKEKIDE